MSDVDVLVVGAGPTGLSLAAMLGRAGLSVRIIDKNSFRSTQSKALGVQAGTMEALEDVFGPSFPKKWVQAGLPARSACVHIDGRSPIEVRFDSIKSTYNYILILAQSETERLLEEKLVEYSLQVERQRELVSLDDFDQSEVLCGVKGESGEVEHIKAKYVVGCDGAHSATRHLAEIPFSGGAYEGSFILGDVLVDWPWGHGEIHAFISKNGVMAGFPMKGDQKYRLIMIPKVSSEPSKSEISIAEFSETAKSLCPEPIRVSDPTWLTRFRVHHRIVNTLKKGNVFLAGDAAHIHSPAGGQGMNTGIQDAFNLGSKLIQVLKYGESAELLERYEIERLPIARQVLVGTDLAFRMLLPKKEWLSRIRSLIFPLILGNRFIQRKVAQVISEVSISRKERPQRLAAFKENQANPV